MDQMSSILSWYKRVDQIISFEDRSAGVEIQIHCTFYSITSLLAETVKRYAHLYQEKSIWLSFLHKFSWISFFNEGKEIMLPHFV